MLTGKEDLIQSLIEAYLMEKGTMDFYSHAANYNFEEAAMTKSLQIPTSSFLIQGAGLCGKNTALLRDKLHGHEFNKLRVER